MKKVLLTVTLFIFGCFANCHAKENESRQFGFHFDTISGNTGVGLHFQSTSFWENKISLALKWTMFETPTISNQKENHLFSHALTLGIIAAKHPLSEYLTVYVEGGMTAILPDRQLTNQRWGYAGSGLFGFNFHMHATSNIFVELGLQGSHLRAEKITNQPYMANGFIIRTGYRVAVYR